MYIRIPQAVYSVRLYGKLCRIYDIQIHLSFWLFVVSPDDVDGVSFTDYPRLNQRQIIPETWAVPKFRNQVSVAGEKRIQNCLCKILDKI